jgi:hypothetical protein
MHKHLKRGANFSEKITGTNVSGLGQFRGRGRAPASGLRRSSRGGFLKARIDDGLAAGVHLT